MMPLGTQWGRYQSLPAPVNHDMTSRFQAFRYGKAGRLCSSGSDGEVSHTRTKQQAVVSGRGGLTLQNNKKNNNNIRTHFRLYVTVRLNKYLVDSVRESRLLKHHEVWNISDAFFNMFNIYFSIKHVMFNISYMEFNQAYNTFASRAGWQQFLYMCSKTQTFSKFFPFSNSDPGQFTVQ